MRRGVLLLASIALAVIFGSGVALADSPTTKEDCKNGGYAKYGFKKQGQCSKGIKLPPPADTTPPDTTVTSGPSMSSNNATNKDATFEFVSSEEGGTFECQLVGLDAAFSPCPSPKNYPNLADGAYTFKVRAIDAAGNVDPTPVEREFRVDTTAPVAAITSGPSEGEVVTTDSVSFGWEATDETGLYMVNCDLGHLVPGGQQWIAPDSGNNLCGGTSANNPSNPATFSNLEDGQYTFYLLARDRGYNGETIERHFTVDTTPS